MNKQKSKTPKTQVIETTGERMVLVAESEWRAAAEAAEMLADVEAYDRAKAAAEDDVLVPMSVLQAIDSGVHPVRAYRDWRGMTAGDLSTLAGVSRERIAQLESGRTRGGIDIYRRLADALGVPIDDISPPAES